MTFLDDIEHAVGTVNWFIAAARALEARLVALETAAAPKAKAEPKAEPKAAETPK